MRVITIWQPYATLIICGLKKFETRGWATNYRGPLIIHAAKNWGRQVQAGCHRVRDCIIEHLGDWVPTDEQRRIIDLPINDVIGCALGVVELVSCEPMMDGGNAFENAVGDFGPERFGWECAKPVAFAHMIPATGKQGLWIPDEPLAMAARKLTKHQRTFFVQ